MKGSTTRVAWRLMRQDPLSFVYSWSLWVAFHLSPLPVGWVLKAVLDHVTHGRTSVPWALLAGLLGLELSRWVVFATAAVQWHGAWVGWQTAPRVTILRSLVSGSGPAAGRLPGSPGEAVSRFRDDVQDLALVLDVWLDISGAVLSASAALVVVAFIAPAAALAVAVPVGVALAFSWWLGPRLRAWRRAAREATAAVTGFIGDTFGAVLAVKVATAEGAVQTRFAALNAERARVSRTDQVATELVRSLGYGTGEVAIGVVLLMVAASFRNGDVSIGDIGLFASYAPVIAGLPKWAGRMGAYLRQADVSVDRLAELLPQPSPRTGVAAYARTHLRHGPPPLPAPDLEAEPLEELRVEGLTVRHEGLGRGVEDVDLVVRRGELVVVTGVVGAGKTTLLRGLLGLVPVESGVVRWNGAVVGDASTYLVPPRVAFLPQVPRLFSEALADTVLLGLPSDGLLDALWLTCLDEDLAEMPDGVGTVIGPRGLRLSGGQVQRAGAARALVRRPELLVVDDLSSALDVATEARLWQRVSEGGFSTALLVSHRPSVLARADRVVTLADGRVVDVRTR